MAPDGIGLYGSLMASISLSYQSFIVYQQEAFKERGGVLQFCVIDPNPAEQL